MHSRRTVVYAAIAANVAIAATKFAAEGATGSSAMRAEAIHSLVDTGNGILLLIGLRHLDVQFRRGLSAGELEQAVERLECWIRKAHPEVERIFPEARSLGGAPARVSSSAPNA